MVQLRRMSALPISTIHLMTRFKSTSSANAASTAQRSLWQWLSDSGVKAMDG